ncbi:hypothetical protein SETIT_9G246300v2 [Setaria italica]|uniref:Uncharacterized protein n=1 Tax=Setaria italica TaxID=4555 RepID=A0A368SM00_SETIT|nr:hypothetical protein SETIT_9G246300v2 [Setaria italica]
MPSKGARRDPAATSLATERTSVRALQWWRGREGASRRRRPASARVAREGRRGGDKKGLEAKDTMKILRRCHGPSPACYSRSQNANRNCAGTLM